MPQPEPADERRGLDFGAVEVERRLVSAAWAQFEQITKGAGVGGSSFQKRGSERVRGLDGQAASFSVPGYRILGEIHRGGQGVVYQAIQESTRRKTAIKVLKEGPFADHAELIRFEREIDVLSRLDHPHIVNIHDRGLTAGHVYYVMDYVAGKSLDAHVAGADMSIDKILSLFAKVCDAVNVAHLRGVIHRDLKPGNILIDVEGQPRILDFGLAKLVQEATESSSARGMTMTGQFIGSVPWASPEQAGARSDLLDIRTDVYSLGVILFQLVTGRFPYPVSGRIDEVVRHIEHTNPARPSTIRQDMDRDVEIIILKCLAKEPERRYQSAGELARDIRLFLAHEPILATPPSTGYRLRKFVQRNRGLVAAAMVIVTMLFIASGVSIAFGIREARARRAAEKALTRAEKAEQQTQTRADELEKVASFQQAQLSGINAQKMGMKLRTDLLEKARAAAQSSNLPPEDVTARVEELEKLVAGSDFTGMALEALHANFFQPALRAIDEQFADQPLVKARLLQTVAITLRDMGLLNAASAPQEEALAIRRRELGNEHVETLSSIQELGILLQAQGKLAEAEPYFREAMEKGRRVLGEEHYGTLTSINNLALLLEFQGKLSEAEPYFREALKKYRRVLGDENVETLRVIHNMGVLLQSQGKFTDAEPYYREALEKRRRMLDAEHPDTLRSLMSMGIVLHGQGKLDQAEPYLREALEKCRRVLGEDHPDTLISINSMGRLLQAQGKLDEAEPYWREALEKRRRLLGDEHPSTLNSINGMGLLLQTQGKLDEAEPYYREALEKRRRVLGEEHPNTLTSISNMGFLLYAQGNLAGAELFYREALDKRRRVLGEDHPDTLVSINSMAVLLVAQGKLDQAEQNYREALEKQRRLLGEKHPDTLVTIVNLGSLLRKKGKPAEAIQLLAPAEPAARGAFTGGNSPRLGRFLTALGRSRAATSEFEKAETNLKEAHAILSESNGATAKDRTDTLTSLVELYDAWHAAEPDKGYDAKAAEWRAKLAKQPGK